MDSNRGASEPRTTSEPHLIIKGPSANTKSLTRNPAPRGKKGNLVASRSVTAKPPRTPNRPPKGAVSVQLPATPELSTPNNLPTGPGASVSDTRHELSSGPGTPMHARSYGRDPSPLMVRSTPQHPTRPDPIHKTHPTHTTTSHLSRSEKSKTRHA